MSLWQILRDIQSHAFMYTWERGGHWFCQGCCTYTNISCVEDTNSYWFSLNLVCIIAVHTLRTSIWSRLKTLSSTEGRPIYLLLSWNSILLVGGRPWMKISRNVFYFSSASWHRALKCIPVGKTVTCGCLEIVYCYNKQDYKDYNVSTHDLFILHTFIIWLCVYVLSPYTHIMCLCCTLSSWAYVVHSYHGLMLYTHIMCLCCTLSSWAYDVHSYHVLMLYTLIMGLCCTFSSWANGVHSYHVLYVVHSHHGLM